MRIWSLHPRYLDSRGLVALWREGLLAQAVLRGKTKGYRHHPQLERFLAQPSPIGAIADYLRAVEAVAAARGYRFSVGKISRTKSRGKLAVTRGQLAFERRHLLGKLKKRDPRRAVFFAAQRPPKPHPLFRVMAGGVAGWEKRPAS